MAQFTVSTQTLAASSALCKVGGEADANSFEMLEDEFGKLLGSGVTSLILELSGLENMTSAALGAIVNMSRALSARGGRLVLTLLRPANEGLLELLSLKDVLTVADSPEAARRMISNTKTP